MKPVHQNNALDNHHTSVIGMSECGKTSVVKKEIIKPTDQVVIFDPYKDYDGELAQRTVRGYSSLRDFAAAVMAGRKTQQGFKIAWQPTTKTTNKEFDQFCRVAWVNGNGRHPKPLKIILEEVAEHSNSAGKADGYHGEILRVGRKFGLHSINIFQAGQEVSKTIFRQCKYAYVMMQLLDSDAEYLQVKMGIPAEEIKALEKLEYIKKVNKDWQKGKIRW
ncbi:ATP-binding protein [Photobacterium halotolerans]|uniref:ATP-binding protein n=1 Tax=Photobacterium halotolerans TaxID=265726 RepID=UPI0013731794|nr:ATP-binding protein [Photobacterium halotolerans]NAW87165.1 ATP-binding protein [Photobacterium halotolerans]